jgi:hypothetical protein
MILKIGFTLFWTGLYALGLFYTWKYGIDLPQTVQKYFPAEFNKSEQVEGFAVIGVAFVYYDLNGQPINNKEDNPIVDLRKISKILPILKFQNVGSKNIQVSIPEIKTETSTGESAQYDSLKDFSNNVVIPAGMQAFMPRNRYVDPKVLLTELNKDQNFYLTFTPEGEYNLETFPDNKQQLTQSIRCRNRPFDITLPQFQLVCTVISNK